MKTISFAEQNSVLPAKILLSLESVIQHIESETKDEQNPFYNNQKAFLKYLKKFPELREGLSDFSNLNKYEEVLEVLLKPFFHELLTKNEIKSAVIPFKYFGIYQSERLKIIMENAGSDFQLKFSGHSVNQTYLFICSYILARYYHQPYFMIDRPITVDIPNVKTGRMHHYRLMFNDDFLEIIKTENAPEVKKEDVEKLLKDLQNIELWKEIFPPDSYIIKGFALMNFFDVTQDVAITHTRSLFLRKDDNVFFDFQNSVRDILKINNLMIGISSFDLKNRQSNSNLFGKDSESLLVDKATTWDSFFSPEFIHSVLEDNNIIPIPSVEQYGKKTNKDNFYKKLKEKKIESILLIPLKINENHIQLVEIASTIENELNPLNAVVLEEIIPFMKIAAERYYEEFSNLIESAIQENYTSIHPTVKWRFIEAAKDFIQQKKEGTKNPNLEDIVFSKIYPLYAQSDIVGSSSARNTSIQEDLILQLDLVIKTFQNIKKIEKLPIYNKLIFRVNKCLEEVKIGLSTGDEVNILEFLQEEIYPVFNHLKTLNPKFKKAIENYISKVDPELKVIFRQRKAYEESVTMLNERLACFLDDCQKEAQKMFPHFFEKYKTDGVEYNMYIGASLVNDRQFNLVYLQNLRLWQLETVCKTEQLALELTDNMPYPLRVASLILVHSSPMEIKFRMGEKQFEVDGAYNIRYEIIKKRIDKSYVKGTKERLTQAGKIAIVYTHEEDAKEYLNYIAYLQAEKLLGKIEMLDLEALQGVSGLKAIRVEVIYKKEGSK